MFVDRVVGVQGAVQVSGQRVQVGCVHAHKVVPVQVEDTTLTVYDGSAAIVAVPRHSTASVYRFRAKHHIRPTRGLTGPLVP